MTIAAPLLPVIAQTITNAASIPIIAAIDIPTTFPPKIKQHKIKINKNTTILCFLLLFFCTIKILLPELIYKRSGSQTKLKEPLSTCYLVHLCGFTHFNCDF